MTKIMVRYSRKKTDGNYGSTEVAFGIEHEVPDIQAVDAAFNQLFPYLKKKVEGQLP